MPEPADRRLGDGTPHEGRGWSGPRWRWRSATASRGVESSTTPTGLAVHVAGVRGALPRGGHRAVYGLGGRRVRQRDVRELFRHARVRTHRPAAFSHGGQGAGVKSSNSSRASTTPDGSTPRSATNRRRTSRNSTMRPEANLQRRGRPKLSGLLRPARFVGVARYPSPPLEKREKETTIKHHQLTVRDSGAGPGHCSSNAVRFGEKTPVVPLRDLNRLSLRSLSHSTDASFRREGTAHRPE